MKLSTNQYLYFKWKRDLVHVCVFLMKQETDHCLYMIMDKRTDQCQFIRNKERGTDQRLYNTVKRRTDQCKSFINEIRGLISVCIFKTEKEDWSESVCLSKNKKMGLIDVWIFKWKNKELISVLSYSSRDYENRLPRKQKGFSAIVFLEIFSGLLFRG